MSLIYKDFKGLGVQRSVCDKSLFGQLFDEFLDFVSAFDLGDRHFMGVTPFFADVLLFAFGFWVVSFYGGGDFQGFALLITRTASMI